MGAVPSKEESMKTIKERLSFIYGDSNVESLWARIEERIAKTKAMPLKARKQNWDQRDVFLITYGDQFQEANQPALKTFKKMFDKYLADKFEIVHLLPFYPYSSDDGFSVIDYKKVNPDLGDWEHIAELSGSARIMFDDVCNHISAKSEWFQEFLKGSPDF